MARRRPPDWALYAVVVGGVVLVSLTAREKADAPPAPPAPDAAEQALLGPLMPFDPSATLATGADPAFQPQSGTAFSVGGEGLWLTARHIVRGCRKPAIVVGAGRAVAADVRLGAQADVALLSTHGGPPALPVAVGVEPQPGVRGFHPGYPRGVAGEATTRLLGPDVLRFGGRGGVRQPVLAWAETGRTSGLKGSLAGLSGAPVLDRRSRVLGVTIAESPRRGLIYTTAPRAFADAVRGVQPADEAARSEPITVDNYGLVADALRRDLRVARVICLST